MCYKTLCVGMMFLFRAIPGSAQEAQQQPPPAKPPAAPPKEEVNAGGGWSIEPLYWLTHTNPDLHAGSTFTGTIPGNLKFPGKAKRAPGAILSFPAGRGSTLRVAAFRIEGGGNTTAAEDLDLLSTGLTKGDLLVTPYSI